MKNSTLYFGPQNDAMLRHSPSERGLNANMGSDLRIKSVNPNWPLQTKSLWRTWKMALYCTRGIRNTRATIANYGEIKKKWSGSFKDAQIDKKYLRQLGFDTTVKKHECPQDKKALLELLNLVACK